MANRDYRKGALPFAFVPIPREVLNSAEYQSLPSKAKALMLDLAAQYTGKNNGRLCPLLRSHAPLRVGQQKHPSKGSGRIVVRVFRDAQPARFETDGEQVSTGLNALARARPCTHLSALIGKV